jgi:predicted aldo/keto reductase-like oxidoreductase
VRPSTTMKERWDKGSRMLESHESSSGSRARCVAGDPLWIAQSLAPRAVEQHADLLSTFVQLWNSSHTPERVEPALDETLKNLGVSYLDLYLMQ